MVQRNLLKEFQQCTEFIIDKLDLRNPEVNFNKLEAEQVGIDYSAIISHSDGKVEFWIRTETDTFDLNVWNNIYYWIGFYNSYDLLLYSQFDIFGGVTAFDISKMNSSNKNKIDVEPGYRNKIEIIRWIEISIDDFILEEEKNKLDILFGDRPIKIYGDWGISISSALSFEIALRGYAALKPDDDILIYKLKHYDGDSIVYSYAIFHWLRNGYYNYSYWSVFPAFCSPDSGTANAALHYVENVIEELKAQVKIDVKEITIAYNDLKTKFLHDADRNIEIINNYNPFYNLNEKLDKINIDIGELKKSIDKLESPEKYLKDILDILNQIHDDDPDLSMAIDEIFAKLDKIQNTKDRLKILIPLLPLVYEKDVTEKIDEIKQKIKRVLSEQRYLL